MVTPQCVVIKIDLLIDKYQTEFKHNHRSNDFTNTFENLF